MLKKVWVNLTPPPPGQKGLSNKVKRKKLGKKKSKKKSKKKRAFIHQKEIFWVKKMTKAVVWFFATTVYIAHRMGWVINVQNHDDIIYCNPVGVLHSEYM